MRLIYKSLKHIKSQSKLHKVACEKKIIVWKRTASDWNMSAFDLNSEKKIGFTHILWSISKDILRIFRSK